MNFINDNTPMETQTLDDFIMLPTNDVCFAGLMENPKVRKGFCAAVMRVHPEEIAETELLPTHLHREYADDKLGILDVRVKLIDGVQINLEMQVRNYEFWDERALFYISKMYSSQLKYGDSYEKLQKCIHVSILDFIRFPDDKKCYRTIHFRDDDDFKLYNSKMELQILELKKLPKEVQTGEDIVHWMRFFNGKSREEFRHMAQTSEYLEEAYEALQKLSADDLKRLEYEARDKALKDYNTEMSCARKSGIKTGIKTGIRLASNVCRLHSQHLSNEAIASECNISVEEVQEIVALFHQ